MARFPRRVSHWCRFALLGACALLAGCRDHAQIAVYEVPKETSAPSVPKRMLAAMVRHGNQTWFFKLTGPESAVTPETDHFAQLIRSIRFDPQSGRPQWKTPEGWQEERASDGIRFATLKKETDGETLEITVTVLPTGPDWDAYVLQNVNRWRGQLGVPPASPEELDKQLLRMPLEQEPDVEVVMVNIEGRGSGAMGAAPPPATAESARPKAGSTKPVDSAGPQDLVFDVPSGWQPTSNDTFSRYAFIVPGDDAAARVTITPLRAAGGDAFLLANINRWRAQVSLPPLSPAQMGTELKDIPFLGGTAKLVLALPEEAAGRNGIIGVIGIHGNTAWFVKMSGDAEFLQEKQAEFEQFVRSIRLKNEASS